MRKNTELRVAIIGLGNMGTGHLSNINELSGIKLAAVCDIVKKRADSAASKYKTRAFYKAEELFSNIEIDAVIIATPHYDHTTIAVAALERNIHVLTEKPMAVHPNDALKMFKNLCNEAIMK